MGNLLADPGFEAGGAWSLSALGAAVVTTPTPRSGTHALQLAAAREVTGLNGQGQPIYGDVQEGSAAQTVAVAAGTPHVLSAWAKCLSTPADLLLVANDGVAHARAVRRAATDGRWRRVSLIVLPAAASVGVTLGTAFTGTPGDIGLWLLDDVRLDPVSIHVALREALLDLLRGIDGTGSWRSRPADVYGHYSGAGQEAPCLMVSDDDATRAPRTLGPQGRRTGTVTFLVAAVSGELGSEAPGGEIDALVHDVELCVGATPGLACPAAWGVAASVERVETSRGTETAGHSVARIFVDVSYTFRGATP